MIKHNYQNILTTILASCYCSAPFILQAQTAPDKPYMPLIDHSPFLSPRAEGLGSALSTLAEGAEAAYFNPAGIGEFNPQHKTGKKPWVRELQLPYLGVSANKPGQNALTGFSKDKTSTERNMGDALENTLDGPDLYSRGSAVLSLELGRVLFLQAEDIQFAAGASSPTAGEDPSKNIKAQYRNSSTSGVGFSVQDSKERFSVGVFSAIVKRQEAAGSFSYDEISDPTVRKKAISENSEKYTGNPTNVGVKWNMAKYAKPTLGLVIRDVQGTKYTDVQRNTDDPLRYETQKEDITLGFSISPKIGDGTLHCIMEESRLSESQLSLNQKWTTAFEYTPFSNGSKDSILALRTGVNALGVSYGLGLNLGLIQVEFASKVWDIGLINEHRAERRNSIVFSTNVLSVD